MSDLKKHTSGVTQNIIASVIVEVFKLGWKVWGSLLIALAFTVWSSVKGLSAWAVGLIGVAVFLVVALAMNLLVKVFTKSVAPAEPNLPGVPSMPQVHIDFRPEIRVSPTITQNAINIQEKTQQKFQQSSQEQSQSQDRPTMIIQIDMLEPVSMDVVIVDKMLFKVLAIPFRNNTDLGDARASSVVAHIHFKHFETGQTHNVNYGYWIEEDFNRATLEMGDTRHIALAGFTQAYPGYWTWDDKKTVRNRATYCNKYPLINGDWITTIELVAPGFRRTFPSIKLVLTENGPSYSFADESFDHVLVVQERTKD